MGISTHILDTAAGRPAAEVPVSLAILTDGEWVSLNETATDGDGRCKHLLPETRTMHAGTYRVRFDTSAYFVARKLEGLYPFVEIVFSVTAREQHYHIPLLLTANGYTTYRGS